jgi:O-antigen/teichoic acid export membrane protein/O-antigen ligase
VGLEHFGLQRGRSQNAFAIGVLALLNGAFLPILFPVATPDDAPSLEGLWLPIYAVLALVVFSTKPVVAIRMRLEVALLGMFLGYALLSALWSIDPQTTVRRVAGLYGTALFGYYLATRFELVRAVRVVTASALACAISSLIYIAVDPREARDPLLSAFRGVFYQKNNLGRDISLGIVAEFALWALVPRIKRRRKIVVSLIYGFSLVLSQSVTSMIVTLVMIVISFLLIKASRSANPGGWGAGVLLALAAILPCLGVPHLSNRILAAVGKDPTLSNRTLVWHDVEQFAAEKPLKGFGFGAFWRGDLGPSGQIRAALNYPFVHSHNGFLDVRVELGWLGVVLLGFTIAMAVLPRLVQVFSAQEQGLPSLLLILVIVLANLDEGPLIGQNTAMTALLVFGILSSRSRTDLTEPLPGDDAGPRLRRNTSFRPIAEHRPLRPCKPDPGQTRGGLGIRTRIGNKIARNGSTAFWTLTSELIKLLTTALLFVLLARVLGVDNYGVYAGAFALVSIFTPFASIGGGHVLVRSLAQATSTAHEAWHRAIFTFLLGAFLFVALVPFLGLVVLPHVAFRLVLLIAGAEFFFTSFVELAVLLGIGLRDFKLTAQVRATLGLVRLSALGLFLLLPKYDHGPVTWSLAYFGSSVVATLLVISHVARSTDLNVRARRVPLKEICEGMPFSVNLAAAYVQDDIDKTMVLRYSGDFTAGFYTAGYRVLNFGLVPISAALAATYGRFFQAGQAGVQGGVDYARRLLLPGLVYGSLAGVVFVFAAPLLKLGLGHSYEQGVLVIRLLAWLPLIRCFETISADVLTGARKQSLRAFLQLASAAANVGLNIWLIPKDGWRGAVYSTAVSESLGLVLLGCAVALIALKTSGLGTALPPN